MNTSELWQAVLGELELSLSKANFTTWFKSTFISDVQEHIVIVGVPNMFTKAWLEKKYTKEILRSLSEHSKGGVKQLNYRVEARPVALRRFHYLKNLRLRRTPRGNRPTTNPARK